MKKIIALVLAAMLVLGLAVTAFAAETVPADLTGHTYTAYQIFSGTQNEEDAELANIEWGAGIDGAALLTALKASADFGTPNPFADCDSAASVAKVLEDWADNSAKAQAFANIAAQCTKGDGIAAVNGQTELDAGYYVIIDTTENVPVGEGSDVYNIALLQLTKKGTFEIATKVDTTKVEKKVSDEGALICENTEAGHVHTKECYNWSDSDTVALGDTVHYNIDTAVPAAAAQYDYYFFVINDTMAKGLTFTQGSIKVTIDGEEATEGTDYTVRYDVDGKTFEVALIDAKANAGKTVEVNYDAVVNSDAIIGVEGNPNEVTVDFSNNPTHNYDGDRDNNNPGFPDKTKNVPTGETPKDITLTFVAQLRIYKVDQDLKALSGAEFTLEGEALNIVLHQVDDYEAAEGGAYWKLTDGTFTKTAPVTENYMEAAAAGATKGYVIAEDGYAGSDKIVVNGVAYREYVPAEDAGMEIYVLVEANADLYDSTTTKYNKVTKLVEKKTASDSKVVGMVDDNGVIVFTGLTSGDYTLSETKAPSGYNPIEPIDFTIGCDLPDAVVTGEETCTWTVDSDDTDDIRYNADENAFEITIVNQKGSVLPETGGRGLVMIYVLGAILLVGAAVLLVIKKRMSAED